MKPKLYLATSTLLTAWLFFAPLIWQLNIAKLTGIKAMSLTPAIWPLYFFSIAALAHTVCFFRKRSYVGQLMLLVAGLSVGLVYFTFPAVFFGAVFNLLLAFALFHLAKLYNGS